MRRDEMTPAVIPNLVSRYPFSFTYGGRPADSLLDAWPQQQHSTTLDATQTMTTTVWTDPDTGLRVEWDAIRFADDPALEWVVYFENTGAVETPIIEDVQALDLACQSPLRDTPPYRLHRTNGAPSNPTDFEVRTVGIPPGHHEHLGGGGGRSSNRDFPFFTVETGAGTLVVAVGWSGQWRAVVSCQEDGCLHLRAGLELTHFRLRPGERVRSPRMLVLAWPGDVLDSHARFRQVIYRHYAAVRNGEKLLPTLFCNTCFTRGGHWLNECDAENQISLIKAYAPLGLEAVITDAGWFEGGWPEGAGNWTPRRDAYPDGMGPVASAAKDHGMIYGLWFEPERVMEGTWLYTHHPEWILHSSRAGGRRNACLLNFGLSEVQDYFFSIVKGFMDLPGFRVYRQDFNIDPLPYWRDNDAPDRQGITEMKYIEGLYAYWDRIAQTWPDSLREECASGGRRIDLETIMRLHIHQKTDYWFDNEVDQASLWGLSQYLPNNLFVAHLSRLDEYSFHSTLASSLCLGWIADAPDFDAQTGKRLLDRYRAVRHLLIGAWYPLLPYSRDLHDWIASQYHRPDLDEGMVLAFRRPHSPYRTADVSLRGLDAHATYDLSFDRTGATARATGADLMNRFPLTLPEPHRSDLVVYQKVSA
ncbi:MAG: alpha-galactosidase [Candidatus Latescibacteria bacterium]|nr:alpha-galactosidase [Candidatus Latescibacterota bacterium]